MEGQRRGDEGGRKGSGRKDRGTPGENSTVMRFDLPAPAGEVRSQLNSLEILTTFNSLELRRRISDL